MNRTTHLGLTQYEGSDKFRITQEEDSINKDMAIIDTHVHEAEVSASAAGNGVAPVIDGQYASRALPKGTVFIIKNNPQFTEGACVATYNIAQGGQINTSNATKLIDGVSNAIFADLAKLHGESLTGSNYSGIQTAIETMLSGMELGDSKPIYKTFASDYQLFKKGAYSGWITKSASGLGEALFLGETGDVIKASKSGTTWTWDTLVLTTTFNSHLGAQVYKVSGGPYYSDLSEIPNNTFGEYWISSGAGPIAQNKVYVGSCVGYGESYRILTLTDQSSQRTFINTWKGYGYSWDGWQEYALNSKLIKVTDVGSSVAVSTIESNLVTLFNSATIGVPEHITCTPSSGSGVFDNTAYAGELVKINNTRFRVVLHRGGNVNEIVGSYNNGVWSWEVLPTVNQLQYLSGGSSLTITPSGILSIIVGQYGAKNFMYTVFRASATNATAAAVKTSSEISVTSSNGVLTFSNSGSDSYRVKMITL